MSTVNAREYLKSGEADAMYTSKNGIVQNYKGQWSDGAYIKGDVVIDGQYQSICIADTSDRSSPQNIGSPIRDVDANILTDITGPTEIVKVTNTYTFTKKGFLEKLFIKVPNWTPDILSRVVLTNVTTGASEIYDNPILSSDTWAAIATGSSIVKIGEQVRIEFSYHDRASASDVTGGWQTNITANTAIVTSAGQVAFDDGSTPTFIKYNYTDLDGTDRTTELNGISIDSIITVNETGDTARFFEAKVTAVDTTPTDGVLLTVTATDTNAAVRDNRTSSNLISIPITVPTHYFEIPSFYPTNNPSFATVTTTKQYDGVLQPEVDSAYGIDLQFQEAEMSDDWKVLAISSAASTGSTLAKVYQTGSVQDILDVQDVTWTQGGAVSITDAPAGEYTLAISFTWELNTASVSKEWRFNINGGVYEEFSRESADAGDKATKLYAFPYTHSGGALSVDSGFRKDAVTGTMNVYFSNVVIEQKV